MRIFLRTGLQCVDKVGILVGLEDAWKRSQIKRLGISGIAQHSNLFQCFPMILSHLRSLFQPARPTNTSLNSSLPEGNRISIASSRWKVALTQEAKAQHRRLERLAWGRKRTVRFRGDCCSERTFALSEVWVPLCVKRRFRPMLRLARHISPTS
jgi:hypothetical protein